MNILCLLKAPSECFSPQSHGIDKQKISDSYLVVEEMYTNIDFLCWILAAKSWLIFHSKGLKSDFLTRKRRPRLSIAMDLTSLARRKKLWQDWSETGCNPLIEDWEKSICRLFLNPGHGNEEEAGKMSFGKLHQAEVANNLMYILKRSEAHKITSLFYVSGISWSHVIHQGHANKRKHDWCKEKQQKIVFSKRYTFILSHVFINSSMCFSPSIWCFLSRYKL